MWKNIVERGRPQVTIWCMRIGCWVPKATNISSGYVIITAFPLHKFVTRMRLNFKLYVYLGPEDDPVKVETCRPVYILYNVYEINCCVID
jgi:hypothetical protein